MNTIETPWPRMAVGNVRIDLVDRAAALGLIFDSFSTADPLAVVSANLDHLHHFADDTAWTSRLPAAPAAEDPRGEMRWLTLLDGTPLVRKVHSLTGIEWPKLSGSDLIEPILATAAERGLTVGFLGGSAETHAQLRTSVGAKLPGLRIAGTWAPARTEIDDRRRSAEIAADIRAANIDILVVGLGKPRQENWIAAFGLVTGARVLLAFGAAVDFLAGRVRRAPNIVAAMGGEWAWRLILEPRRLGRRYLIQGPPAFLQLHRGTTVVDPR